MQFAVQPHKVLKREGIDLVYELPLNLAEAALGTERRVPTLEGEETLAIPAGTQHGRVFRIREKGVPRLQRSGRGDYRVVVRVEVPRNLSPRQRELLTALAETFEAPPALDGAPSGGANAAGAPPNGRAAGGKHNRGLFNKVKDALGLDE